MLILREAETQGKRTAPRLQSNSLVALMMAGLRIALSHIHLEVSYDVTMTEMIQEFATIVVYLVGTKAVLPLIGFPY